MRRDRAIQRVRWTCGLLPAVLLSAELAFAQAEPERLIAPPGFEIRVYAEGLRGPLGMAFGSDGWLYVALSEAGRVVRLSDADGDGVAEETATLIDGLEMPGAVAFAGDALWVAESGRVGRLRATSPGAEATYEVVVDSLPVGPSPILTLLFEPRGDALYIPVPASCDVCREDDPRRATILRYNLRTGELAVWARGLRAVGGLAFHPETGELWATESGRDGLGDRLPPDELNVIRRGRHYGWPYCYGHRIPSPEFADGDRCDVSTPPVVAFSAHSGPRGLAFAGGTAFPTAYEADAFVALGGRGGPAAYYSGYEVVRLRVADGRPVGLETFVSGWLGRDGRAWGRPAATLVGPDGALYVSDDAGGRIWRISYRSDH